MTAEASSTSPARSTGGPGFAELLRQRRRAAGLTQVELARQAGLAVRTVRDVERGRTQRPQRTTAVLLADALGLTGEERAGFLGAARGEGAWPVPPRPRAAVTGRGIPLPPAPPLVGRDTELVRLAELLADPVDGGPVTLVGVAGVGKSALALAVAHQVAARFPGGVAGVTAAHHRRTAELVAAVGAAFSESGEKLAERLAAGPVLLLMDAVDRDPGEVRAALAQLPGAGGGRAGAVPRLRVLTTGRAPLGLPTEQIWPVAPLPVPPASADMELAAIGRYPAAALFLDRLARVRPAPPAIEELPALVGLVRRLGGLPLALELAAACGRLLRLPEILQRYGDRVLDLGGGDEHTLRAAVASSYRLLRPPEQTVLRWLSAFRDWWSVELAEQLLEAEGRRSGAAGRAAVADPVPVLDRLVSLGLVEVRDPREHRFRLLEVVRDFAAEQAQRHDELADARRAHAEVVTQLVTRTGPALAGPELPAAVARLDEAAGEVWTALNHAANDDPPAALRLAAALPRWWRFRGWDVAGRRWLRRLLDDPRTAGADPATRAWALVGLVRLAHEHGESATERAAAETALAEFQRLGDVAGEVAAGNLLSAVCRAERRYDQAREYAVAALATATRHGRARDTAMAHLNLTGHELRVADLAAARRRLAAVDRVATQLGDARLRLLATAQLAEVARLEGRYEDAAATGRRALARLGELGDPGHRRRLLGTVGQALATLGRIADTEPVLARLRGDDREPVAAAEGACAAIEARLALARGDLPAAAEWFATAASNLHRGEDRRQLVEALVERAACLTDAARQRDVLAELERVCREDGFVLCERERAILDRIAE